MAKFSAFGEQCDASAVLTLLGVMPVFSTAVQAAAGHVRNVRNDWAHCVFSKWDPVTFQQSFVEMEHLVRVMALPAADEAKLLGELKDWETKGVLHIIIQLMISIISVGTFLTFAMLTELKGAVKQSGSVISHLCIPKIYMGVATSCTQKRQKNRWRSTEAK